MFLSTGGYNEPMDLLWKGMTRVELLLVTALVDKELVKRARTVHDTYSNPATATSGESAEMSPPATRGSPGRNSSR